MVSAPLANLFMIGKNVFLKIIKKNCIFFAKFIDTYINICF